MSDAPAFTFDRLDGSTVVIGPGREGFVWQVVDDLRCVPPATSWGPQGVLREIPSALKQPFRSYLISLARPRVTDQLVDAMAAMRSERLHAASATLDRLALRLRVATLAADTLEALDEPREAASVSPHDEWGIPDAADDQGTDADVHEMIARGGLGRHREGRITGADIAAVDAQVEARRHDGSYAERVAEVEEDLRAERLRRSFGSDDLEGREPAASDS